MILLLLLLLLLFLTVIFLLLKQIGHQQQLFSQRMRALEQIAVDLNHKTIEQNRNIQLIEDLESTLQSHKSKLGNMIFSLHYDLFDLLAQHNLLK